MAMLAWDDDFEIPQFFTRQAPVIPYREEAPCNAIKARTGDLWGAAVRFLRRAADRVRPGIGASQFIGGYAIMRNGKDTMSIQDETQRGRDRSPAPRIVQNIGQSAPSPLAMRSIVDDVASAVERLRRIEGERGLYNMLETLLQGSRSVLVEHGIMPPQQESAELESLRAQLVRAAQSRDTNHAYARHYADTLSQIVNLNQGEASEHAKRALEKVFDEKGRPVEQPQ